MKISQNDVEHVARLARLSLEPDELQTMTRQMDVMLGYVEKLNELDTTGIEPMAHAVPMSNAFRKDESQPVIGIERALQNAPASGENCFKVPKVIE
ncbi:aspartyl/glutamyl-tRNA(Asn/Gln) amidotransferase subunit C [Desulfuromusa kysingii]|uniref:Aspartyl/glutamyl-tRNA(Asn/Gln) amidotransferase subunit C n=1 Tax=Desulfuromusa kysingii TaxID=37625 RepID=A0A1H4DW75_9BACT|nr:Asp-tRNA(Asn)/Glu-tRNA(Gln) amidotransferase subunit GatC [Desulfuromusa kysingii]SEA77023.1 aspartyl/glutamyl-tRNA(Asn/Gln) amidotransferase subunit C [Desulfuromusa kysingii]